MGPTHTHPDLTPPRILLPCNPLPQLLGELLLDRSNVKIMMQVGRDYSSSFGALQS